MNVANPVLLGMRLTICQERFPLLLAPESSLTTLRCIKARPTNEPNKSLKKHTKFYHLPESWRNGYPPQIRCANLLLLPQLCLPTGVPTTTVARG